jgi:hypothetical protein
MEILFRGGNYVLATETKELPTSGTLPPYVSYYQKRYGVPDLFTKLVDNSGNGFTDLYGVRNFRVVLNGVVYRGGANNKYNKNKIRDNRNPLPVEGMNNLCKEGFSSVYYMYTTNYDKNLSRVKCKTERGVDQSRENEMAYLQKGPWDQNAQHTILKTIFNAIMNPKAGPVYLHCWNGWHASGLISAFTLRQFCNFTGEQAVKYWDLNTDGNNKGKSYDSYRAQIRNFKQFSDLTLSAEISKGICLAPPKI